MGGMLNDEEGSYQPKMMSLVMRAVAMRHLHASGETAKFVVVIVRQRCVCVSA